MSHSGNPRPVTTFYCIERGRPSFKDYDRIGHAVKLENAIVAATKRVVQGDFSSALICDAYGTPVVWLNTSADHMKLITTWLEE